MTKITACFLLVAFTAYVLFGGADFGAGILEATLRKPALRKKLQATLAPIWEANHVWLIAVVVILFVGFPRFYATALTRLYLPISLALLAILLRGTFFTLRKYDPQPGAWGKLYSSLFRLSSLAAPLFFGFILSGLLATHPGTPGSIPHEQGYFALYVAPWADWFGLASGAFIASLFGYAAAVFFYGDVTAKDDRAMLRKRILQFFAATFILGGVVLLLGALTGRVSSEHGMHPIQIGSQIVAAIAVFVLYRAEASGKIWRMRLAVGAQILAILFGWWSARFPMLLKTEGGPLTLDDAAAPHVTLLWLVIGLIVVLSLVVPLLVLLFRVFREKSSENHV